jgi:hypothetical protein
MRSILFVLLFLVSSVKACVSYFQTPQAKKHPVVKTHTHHPKKPKH